MFFQNQRGLFSGGIKICSIREVQCVSGKTENSTGIQIKNKTKKRATHCSAGTPSLVQFYSGVFDCLYESCILSVIIYQRSINNKEAIREEKSTKEREGNRSE